MAKPSYEGDSIPGFRRPLRGTTRDDRGTIDIFSTKRPIEASLRVCENLERYFSCAADMRRRSMKKAVKRKIGDDDAVSEVRRPEI